MYLMILKNPTKHRFSRGVYCFKSVRNSMIPKFCHSVHISRFLMYNFRSFFQFCSNFQHTLTIRHCMFYRKIGAEGSVLQELCHFVIMPPTVKKWGTYWFRLVHMCVCVCIHVRDIVLKLHVWIPHGKIPDAYFCFSLNYLPLLNYGPLTNKGMKFCKCRISKSILLKKSFASPNFYHIFK